MLCSLWLWLWVPRDARSGVLQTQWRGNLEKRLSVTFPGWPNSTPMCQALCHLLPARASAWHKRSRCPQVPWGHTATQAAAQCGQYRHKVIWMDLSRRKKMMPKPSVTTTGSPGGPSPGVLWQLLTPNLLGVWSKHCSPLQPWPYVTLTTSLCHQSSQRLCSPGHVGLHLQLEIIPASSHCAWNAAKPHPGACIGISQSWAHLSGLSPAASHLSPCPRAPESWAGPTTTSRMGFSGKMQHSCAWLLSPQWMGWAGVSSSPLFGHLPGARPRKASLCSPHVMALAVEIC